MNDIFGIGSPEIWFCYLINFKINNIFFYSISYVLALRGSNADAKINILKYFNFTIFCGAHHYYCVYHHN